MAFFRKVILSSVVIFAASVSTFAATPINVVLLGGQSNMVGYAYSMFLPPALQVPQTDVLYYDGAPFVGAPTLQALQPTARPGDDTFGPEVTFGRTWADAHPGEKLALIKYAIGGTTLGSDWHPTDPVGNTYTAFKAAVTAGLQSLTNAGYSPNIIGMLWLQGENDSTSASYAAAYEQNLINLIADVRGKYGANLPVVIGGIGDVTDGSLPYRSTVVAAFQDVAATVNNVRYFSNDDFNTADGNIHFNSFEMPVIGERFASNLDSISVPEPTCLSLLMLGSLLLCRR